MLPRILVIGGGGGAWTTLLSERSWQQFQVLINLINTVKKLDLQVIIHISECIPNTDKHSATKLSS